MTLDAFVVTDVGCVREHNEDDSLILPEHGVYVVADGMGGHACGEVASAISVKSVREFYVDQEITERLRQVYRELRASGNVGDVASFHEFRLRSAVEYGNVQIFRHAASDPDLEDMGTTLVALTFVGSRVYVGYVGDSRAYRYRRGRLEQVTVDHSLANEFIRMNILRPEDLPKFPYKNVIVRALGLQEEVVVDTFWKTSRPGDRYLLCSDGLTDLVADEEILAILDSVAEPDKACQALTGKALDYGGVDNITVLVVDVHR